VFQIATSIFSPRVGFYLESIYELLRYIHINKVVTGSGTIALDGPITGSLIVCGPSVSLARGGGGNLYIQNGNVEDIESYTGNISIKNGQPTGSISIMLGNLAWEYLGTVRGRTYSGL